MRKGEKKKQDILDTARALFAKKGYVNTSIQDILDQLDCSKGSFYHHFSAKFEVLADIARERAQKALAAYQNTLFLDPMDALNSLLRRAAYLTREDLPVLGDLIALKAEFDGAALLSVMHKAASDAFYPPFALLLNALRKAGKAVFLNESALRLAFVSFLAGSAVLVFDAGEEPGQDPADRLALLRSLRRQTEVCLGLSPGSVFILEHEELSEMARLTSAQAGGEAAKNLRVL